MSLAKWIGLGGGTHTSASAKAASDAAPAEIAKVAALSKGEHKRFGLENVRIPPTPHTHATLHTSTMDAD